MEGRIHWRLVSGALILRFDGNIGAMLEQELDDGRLDFLRSQK
jgi:hypothetical protein